MLLLSKLFFWLSAGLGALSSLASGWETLMVPGVGGWGGGWAGGGWWCWKSQRGFKRKICVKSKPRCVSCAGFSLLMGLIKKIRSVSAFQDSGGVQCSLLLRALCVGWGKRQAFSP